MGRRVAVSSSWWSLATLVGALGLACGGSPETPATALSSADPERPSPHSSESAETSDEASPAGAVSRDGRSDGEQPPADEAEAAPSPTSAAPPQPDPPAFLYSVGYVTWIWPKPAKTGSYLGYIRVGSPVPLRDREKVPGPGCSQGYYQVQPHGYVCDDRTVSRTPDPEFLSASRASAAKPGPFPYRYALSNGAPMYNRIPTPEEQERFERAYGERGEFRELSMHQRSHGDLAVTERIAPSDPVPEVFANGGAPRKPPFDLVRQTIPLGSMLSFSKSFEAEGRTWLLSADHTLVPADRVRPFRPSAFVGVKLTPERGLPLAFTRERPRAKYIAKDGSSAMVEGGESWPARAVISITGNKREVEGKLFWQTKGGTWLADEDATLVTAEPEIPIGVKPGQKWFIIYISQGTLVAYEGLTPVYTTLISPGAGGVSVRGQDNVKYSTTPRGTYYITFKDRAATMSPETGLNRSFWIQDVPHTMYFNPPFAIHGAYWHERFGQFVSAGCVNLSPLDAERLFNWADPQVPEGWQGATGAGAPENGKTTAVVIRR